MIFTFIYFYIFSDAWISVHIDRIDHKFIACKSLRLLVVCLCI